MSEKKRLNVEVPSDLLDQLNTLVPWGVRRRLITRMLERFVWECREKGPLLAIHDVLQWRNSYDSARSSSVNEDHDGRTTPRTDPEEPAES